MARGRTKYIFFGDLDLERVLPQCEIGPISTFQHF